jgi:excinuclease ABC subunit B
VGERIDQRQLLADLVALQYKRNDAAFQRGTFRVRGDTVEVFPAHYEDRAWRLSLFGDEIEAITEFDPLTGQKSAELKASRSTPTRTTSRPSRRSTRPSSDQGRAEAAPEEFQRRMAAAGGPAAGTAHPVRPGDDEATGSCAGIENYSRYLTAAPRRAAAHPVRIPARQRLVFVDESHVTVPQIGGMYRGDFRRKATLAEYGFRLPSCIDNRPLRFEEWDDAPADRLRLGHARRLGDGAPAASSPNRSSAPPA